MGAPRGAWGYSPAPWPPSERSLSFLPPFSAFLLDSLPYVGQLSHPYQGVLGSGITPALLYPD